MPPRRAIVAFLLLSALLFPGRVTAQSAITVGDTTGWTAWTTGTNFAKMTDAQNDQQTGQHADDFVGDATYAGMQQKAGLLGGTDTILWRFRFDDFAGADKFGGNGGNVGLGMDLDGNGSMDFIMVMSESSGNVGNRTRTLSFGTPGAGANDGPSTTTWTIPTQTALNLTVNTTYDLVATTDGYNFAGTQDSWLTFGISFNNLQNAIRTYASSSFSSYTVSYTSAIAFIAFTSTQTNALNQDLFGASKAALTAGSADNLSSFATLGAVTPPTDAFGTAKVPEPSTYAQVGAFLLCGAGLAWRRRKATAQRG